MKINASAIAGTTLVVGAGFLVWLTFADRDIGPSVQASRLSEQDQDLEGSRQVLSETLSAENLPLKEGGLAVMRAVSAVQDFDEYVEWGSVPERPAQSIGPDLDADDLSVLNRITPVEVGSDIDIDDYAVLDTNVSVEVGASVDADDMISFEVSVVPQDLGEDLDAETPEG